MINNEKHLKEILETLESANILKQLYESIPKSWKRKIDKIVSSNKINLFDR